MKKVYVKVTTKYGHVDQFLINFDKVNTSHKLQFEANRRYPGIVVSAVVL